MTMVLFTYVRHIVALCFYNQFRVPCNTLKMHAGKCILWEKSWHTNVFVCLYHSQITVLFIATQTVPQKTRKSNVSTYHVRLPTLSVDTAVNTPPEIILRLPFPGKHRHTWNKKIGHNLKTLTTTTTPCLSTRDPVTHQAQNSVIILNYISLNMSFSVSPKRWCFSYI